MYHASNDQMNVRVPILSHNVDSNTIIRDKKGQLIHQP